MANIFDLLFDAKRVVKINDNISMPYIAYLVSECVVHCYVYSNTSFLRFSMERLKMCKSQNSVVSIFPNGAKTGLWRTTYFAGPDPACRIPQGNITTCTSYSAESTKHTKDTIHMKVQTVYMFNLPTIDIVKTRFILQLVLLCIVNCFQKYFNEYKL